MKTKIILLLFLFLSTSLLPLTAARPIEVRYEYDSKEIGYGCSRTASTDSLQYEKVHEYMTFNFSKPHKLLFWFLHWHLDISPGTYREIQLWNLGVMVLMATFSEKIFQPVVLRWMKIISYKPMKELRQVYPMVIQTATELMNHKESPYPIYVPTEIKIRMLPRHILP